MEFHRLREVRISSADEVFRQSPWNSGIAVLFCLGFAAVPMVLAARGEGWWFYLLGGLALLIASFFWGLWRKALRPTNWLLRVQPDGHLVIKYRSYANVHLPADDVVAFTLAPSEVHSAFIDVTRTLTRAPGNGSGVRQERITRLALKVAPDLVEQLQPRLQAERQRQGEPRGILKARSKSLDYPVGVESDLIRLTWRSQSASITPGIERALAVLQQHGIASAANRAQVVDYATPPASRREADTKILDLAERGDVLAASKLACATYGYTLAEARQFIDELMGKQAPGPDDRAG